jgi:hypothetical protein
MTLGHLGECEPVPLPIEVFDGAAPDLAIRLIGVSRFVVGVGA